MLRLEMIKFLFCLHYRMHVLYCGPEDQGHDGSSRDRLYILLSHRERTVELHNPLELYRTICTELRRHLWTQPADYCIAADIEITTTCAST